MRLLLTLLATVGLQAAPVKIPLGTLPGLQFDKPRFSAEPGQAVEITFKNNDEMAHNLVFIAPGKRLDVVQAAALLPPDSNYIPSGKSILWHTPVLKPDETATLKFTAPREKGIYPYVCTFPGHGLVMYGAMYVGIKMPTLAQDENVSPLARAGSSNKTFHAWPHRRPLMYRIFMPDASPAAIAVALPHGISYCWDAGRCRLRYAWIGGFVDPMPVWRGNGNGLAKIIGNKFWTAPDMFPIQIGRALQKVEFKGYHKIDGHPVFHYNINGQDIFERINALPDGMGIARHFRIPGVTQPVRLTLGKGHAEIDSEITNGVTTLPPGKARAFTITHRHVHKK